MNEITRLVEQKKLLDAEIKELAADKFDEIFTEMDKLKDEAERLAVALNCKRAYIVVKIEVYDSEAEQLFEDASIADWDE